MGHINHKVDLSAVATTFLSERTVKKQAVRARVRVYVNFSYLQGKFY